MCTALPLVKSPRTSITCTTQQDTLTRIANTDGLKMGSRDPGEAQVDLVASFLSLFLTST